jgi:hypothetical protein
VLPLHDSVHIVEASFGLSSWLAHEKQRRPYR